MGLGRRAPGGIGPVLLDGDAEQDDDDVGHQGGLPVHHEHDHHAEDGPSQREPHAVVLVLRPPAWRLSEADVHDAEVDEAVGGHEEVGQEAGDL